MTRKDYRMIADAIATTHEHNASGRDYAEGWHAALSAVRERLIPALAADNPRFNADTFREACNR